jgi:hypothetical protein
MTWIAAVSPMGRAADLRNSPSDMARRVIATDLDPKMLDLARVRTASATNCGFIVGNAYDLVRLVPGSVTRPDREHLPRRSRQGAARPSLAAVLKPGGGLVVVNWHRRPVGSAGSLNPPL